MNTPFHGVTGIVRTCVVVIAIEAGGGAPGCSVTGIDGAYVTVIAIDRRGGASLIGIACVFRACIAIVAGGGCEYTAGLRDTAICGAEVVVVAQNLSVCTAASWVA